MTLPTTWRLTCGALFATATLTAWGWCAATPPQAPGAQARAEPELSREQAVEMVQKRYGARVVRAEFLDQEGRHVYVFRLLSAAGKVWIVRVDARTGTEVP
jgi:uncharacterized iron-regulated membrane protein